METQVQSKIKSFDVLTTPLVGKNLIEASAGTGKTFSLAIMAVRLIVEQGMLPKEILMVTFTEAATAELQQRMRAFIRQAYRYATDASYIPNPNLLIKVVDQNRSLAKDNLAKAINQLDELNIFTIHGFCQRTLGEFAFETGEAFGKELVKEITPIYDELGLDFIRNNIYQLSLDDVINLKNTFNSIFNIKIQENYLKSQIGEISYDEYVKKYELEKNKIINTIKDNPNYHLVYNLLANNYNQVFEKFNSLINEKNVFSFNHLIDNVYNSINNELIKQFKLRYKALFIDEFQDTNAKQYHIFKNLFPSQIVFIIGDPKQAIYGFTGGDIYTYFKGKNEVDVIYTLNKNFRSSPKLIQSINTIFDQSKNPFYSNQLSNIEYYECRTLDQNEYKYAFDYDGEVIDQRLHLNPYKVSLATLYKNIASDIFSLIENGRLNNNKINPGQITFIGRTNNVLASIKKELDILNIPSVIVNEEKIFNTSEFSFIKGIIKGIRSRNKSAILEFLNHQVFNYSVEFIQNLDLTPLINQFYKYSILANEKGIYDTLKTVFEDFKINQNAIQHIENHQKFWANCNQIAEQLQYIQTNNNLTFSDLIQKIENNEIGQDDEFETRLESDENAVQLMTIHKSKGLEFDFVFSILPNSKPIGESNPFYRYYNPNENDYNIDINFNKIANENNELLIQRIQEDRRLIYVTLTRAKHNLFGYYKPIKSVQSHHSFQNLNLEDIKSFPFKAVSGKYSSNQSQNINPIPVPALTISDAKYRKMSFSGLSGNHGHFAAMYNEMEYDESSYEKFIFEDLVKGTTTGNLIHNLFEYIDFTNEDQWDKIIQNAIRKFAPNKKDIYEKQLPLFIQHVLQNSININGKSIVLADVTNSKKINELEFDIRANQVDLSKLEEIKRDDLDFSFIDTKDYYGMLNGLIDLVFEHEGKYYILDWKTNFLGNHTDDYIRPNLLEAMRFNNYLLQYTIYTYALNKYLESRIPEYNYDTHFGGVIYLFVRGMRQNETTGIFTNRITKDELEVINEALS